VLVLYINSVTHARVANGRIPPFGKGSSASMKVSVGIPSIVTRKTKAVLRHIAFSVSS
jgi:hypothetical protein